MKQLLLVVTFILVSLSSAWSGDFEETKKLAEQGDPISQRVLGIIYYEGNGVSQDVGQALYWLKKAAEQGEVLAQAILGVIYNDGAGVSKDYKRAIHWLTKAAEQGNDVAQKILGKMYLGGKGVPKDSKKAAHYFTKAAEKGCSQSQYSLGMLHYYGQGLPKDYEQAVYWFTKAAEQGNFEAQRNLGTMYMEGQGVPKDYEQALYWLTKAAEQGDPFAQLNLGTMYFNGQGLLKDCKKALYWLSKAGEQNVLLAQLKLGMILYDGLGVPKDYKQGGYWFTKAAEQGDPLAQYRCGRMYYDGQGVTQDYKQAVYWFTKAAEQGNFQAQGYLGVMYFQGDGVPQNFKLSYVWTNMAASNGNEEVIEFRDSIAKSLSSQQLVEAQELALKIQYQIDHPSGSKEPQPSIGKARKTIIGSGTGFLITKDGFILTCHHVIKDANEVQIVVSGNTFLAKIIRDDPYNDLALLKIDGSFSALAFSQERSAKMGQKVFTIGYPNQAMQGVSAKYTEGTISSPTGFQDDLRLYQISVPVQPGNSGGALLDENGNVLGVIVAMLDAKTTFRVSGSLPQNVNYAIKRNYAQAMLDTIPEISNKLISHSSDKSDAVERARNATVMVLSYE